MYIYIYIYTKNKYFAWARAQAHANYASLYRFVYSFTPGFIYQVASDFQALPFNVCLLCRI